MARTDQIIDAYDRQLDVLNLLLDNAVGRNALFF